MNSTKKQFLFIFLLVDLIILMSSYIVMESYLDLQYLKFYHQISYPFVIIVLWITSYFCFTKNFYYHKDSFSGYFKKISKRSLLFFAFVTVPVTLFFPEKFHSVFIKQIILFYISLIGFYYLVYNYLKFKRETGIHIQRAAIITKCKTGVMLQQIMKCNPILGFKFVGFLVKDNYKIEPDVIGSIRKLDLIIKKYHLQTIFLVQNISYKVLDPFLVSVCEKNGVRLRLVSRKEKLCSMLMNANSSDGMDIIRIHEIPLDDKANRIIKRIFDFFFSLTVILAILSWITPILALLIKFTSRGPVFFCQKRTGEGNNTFTCLKFRTMVENELSDIKQATVNDSRITLLGRFLRNTNMDELPQFFNVLLGQMSVVGPRPHMLKHTEKYSQLIDNYLIRHYVKPGITGWAQINGFHGETQELWKMEKRVEYDKHYLQNWTFFWDLKIIFQTMIGFKIHERIKSRHIKDPSKSIEEKQEILTLN